MDFEVINSREFAKRVIDYRNDKNITTELQIIHNKIFGKYFKSNCGSCIKQAYVNIREYINNNTNMIFKERQSKNMGQFELKKGVNGISKQIHIGHDIITNDNLTDEKAIAILKKHPSHIVTFERAPENWMELCGFNVSKKETEKKSIDTESENVETTEVKSKVTESKKKASGK